MQIPPLWCPYPMRRSPHYDEIVAPFHDWFLSAGPFAESRRHRVRATDYPYLAAVCWPASDGRRLWDIAAMAGAFTERDGEYDSRRFGGSLAELRASVADTRSHYRVVTETRWGTLFADIWRRFTEYLPPGQAARFAEVMATFLDGCVAYDQHLIAHGHLTNVDEYLRARYLPLGQLIDHVMIEISLGIDLGGVLDEPALQDVIRADVERVAVYQDILSLRKDLAEGEDAENIVLVIARAGTGKLPEALARACELHREKMTAFEDLAARLEAHALGRTREVGLFVNGLRNFTAGLIEWTQRSARYTLQDVSGWHVHPDSGVPNR